VWAGKGVRGGRQCYIRNERAGSVASGRGGAVVSEAKAIVRMGARGGRGIEDVGVQEGSGEVLIQRLAHLNPGQICHRQGPWPLAGGFCRHSAVNKSAGNP